MLFKECVYRYLNGFVCFGQRFRPLKPIEHRWRRGRKQIRRDQKPAADFDPGSIRCFILLKFSFLLYWHYFFVKKRIFKLQHAHTDTGDRPAVLNRLF